MSRETALQVNNLRVSYLAGAGEVKAVDDVTFSLYRASGWASLANPARARRPWRWL